jgi:hypothetical protein
MAESEKQTSKERLKDITDSIERGIQDLFQSDKYADYLRTMSRFHRYSVNNTMLIYMQKPDATLVAGFNKWRDQFERNVMKGEKGIKIIAPTPYKKKIEQEKLDPDTKMPMLDSDGRVITEEKEIKIPMYKPVTVFDVSQTDGKPLPQLASDLSGNVQNYEVFMEALRRSSPVPISIKPIRDGADGFFSLDSQSITIREGMSEIQTVSAVVHEIAHSKLHNQKKIEEPKSTEKYQEVEIFDVPALFSNGRVTASDIPDGLYCYDLRGSDDDPGQPVTVENHVAVNHAGSLITAKPLDLGEDGRLYLTENEGLNFVGGEITAYRFFNEQLKDRNTEEVEAESISYAVCAYYGIATGENSFGYIATWSKDKELKELRASLETINKTSSELITDIDRHYGEIMKERESEVALESEESDSIDEVARNVEEEPPTQAPDNGYMPDPSMSVEAMNAYGYTDSDMLPLSKERALELFERDVPIYMLYEGNTEAMAFESEDIMLFSGCFGVSREDWDAIKNEVPPMVMELIRRKQEQAFLNSAGDSYAIYQLRHDDSTADIRFMGSDWLEKKGIEPQRENYELVYTGALTEDGSQIDKLEGLYRTFNIERPQDFTGHSLSVSDIVALKQAGMVSFHYVDSVGYRELPGFIKTENYLKNAEIQVEDDYGMIDGIVNNGPRQDEKPQEKTKAKKPSVLAKLRKYQEEDRQATKMHRSAERDL